MLELDRASKHKFIGERGDKESSEASREMDCWAKRLKALNDRYIISKKMKNYSHCWAY
jgi:hypothetical protein